VLSMWLTFLMLLLCLGYVAPMGVSLACTMLCFYGLNYATVCACLYDTSMLASMIYLWATIRGLSLLVTTSLVSAIELCGMQKGCQKLSNGMFGSRNGQPCPPPRELAADMEAKSVCM
jgi:hypothetical protein